MRLNKSTSIPKISAIDIISLLIFINLLLNSKINFFSKNEKIQIYLVLKFKEIEFTQNLLPEGSGPSLKTCPK